MRSFTKCIFCIILNPLCLLVLFLLLFIVHIVSLYHPVVIRPLYMDYFLILQFIRLCSSLVYFNNGPSYLTRKTTRMFMTLIRYQLQRSLSRSFLVHLTNLFLTFSFVTVCLMVPLPIFPSTRNFIHLYHHHAVPLAQISLTLSRHFSLLFITSGRSSGLHPVSSHSCCMYVRGGRPGFARPYAGVHRSTSLMNLSLLLQQCPEYLVRLTWIVLVMGGRWPYSWCLVGCCQRNLFSIARSILV